MAFDHGVLNLPLAQRGDIDRQIDAHKATLKRDAKAERKQFNADRAAAKLALAGFSDELIARLSAKAGLTVTQGKKKLSSMAYFEPSKILAFSA